VSRTAEVFARARAEGRAALVGYLPAGFPTLDGGVASMRALVEGGADMVEIGLPYSDPLIDGPTIQAAAERALANGTTLDDLFRTVEQVACTGASVVVMTYWNPVERTGVEEFARRLADAGGAGVITPDLIPDEAGEWIAASDAAGLDRIFLVAPASSEARLETVAAASTGWIYAASTMGVTGTRDQAPAAAPELVARTRKHTDLPVCVGLGVSSGAQAAEVASYADGVIVGSAFVRRLLDAPEPKTWAEQTYAFAVELSEGVRRGRRGH
jgi:tryptophan synthase alpha chain